MGRRAKRFGTTAMERVLWPPHRMRDHRPDNGGAPRRRDALPKMAHLVHDAGLVFDAVVC